MTAGASSGAACTLQNTANKARFDVYASIAVNIADPTGNYLNWYVASLGFVAPDGVFRGTNVLSGDGRIFGQWCADAVASGLTLTI